MKKTLIYLSILLMCGSLSCTKDFADLNTNPAQFSTPDVDPVLTGVFVNTINKLEFNNIIWLWEYSHLIDPIGRYGAGDDNTWQTMYVAVLGNTRQLKNIYGTNPAYKNRMAIVDIWECYVYAYLVGTYGPIPYSQAGNINSSVVNYDDENAIYTSLLSRLKDDAAAISTTGDKLTTDVIYNGNLTLWTRFANSLRLRLALRVQNNLPDLAVSNIRELMANENAMLNSDADDPKLSYGSVAGSQSVYYTQLVAGNNFLGAAKPLMSDYVFTYFRSYKDPRLDAYFQTSATGYGITDTLTSTNDTKHYVVTYKIPHLGQPKSGAILPQWNLLSGFGLYAGAVAPGSYSTLQPALTASTRPFYIMTYAEVCFMKAEAALKGYGGTQTADQYYYAGINANFSFWNLTAAQSAAYQGQNGIKWNTAGKGFNYALGFISTSIPADNLTKIYTQEWINYFDDGGFDAWALQRRTQNLKLPPHTNASTIGLTTTYGDLPDRWPYPTVVEVPVNPIGYQNGLKLLGGAGDFAFTTLKIEPPFTRIDWTKVKAFQDYGFIQKWYGNNIEDLKNANISYTVLSTY